MAATLGGMAWLSRVGADSAYLTACALPMAVTGIGHGLAFAPMTSAGLAGVDARDAGAASGLVNAAHQLGSALRRHPRRGISCGRDQRSTAALTGGSVLLAAALLLVVVLITRRLTGHGSVTSETDGPCSAPWGLVRSRTR